MNGGYIMIDATGLDVSVTTEQTVTGIYDQIDAAAESGKMIMMTGADNNGTLITPFVAQCEAGSNSYTLKNGVYVFAVASDDGVTVSAAGPGSDVVSFPGFPNLGEQTIASTIDMEVGVATTLESDGYLMGYLVGDSNTDAELLIQYNTSEEDGWNATFKATDSTRVPISMYLKEGTKLTLVSDVASEFTVYCTLFN